MASIMDPSLRAISNMLLVSKNGSFREHATNVRDVLLSKYIYMVANCRILPQILVAPLCDYLLQSSENQYTTKNIFLLAETSHAGSRHSCSETRNSKTETSQTEPSPLQTKTRNVVDEVIYTFFCRYIDHGKNHDILKLLTVIGFQRTSGIFRDRDSNFLETTAPIFKNMKSSSIYIATLVDTTHRHAAASRIIDYMSIQFNCIHFDLLQSIHMAMDLPLPRKSVSACRQTLQSMKCLNLNSIHIGTILKFYTKIILGIDRGDNHLGDSCLSTCIDMFNNSIVPISNNTKAQWSEFCTLVFEKCSGRGLYITESFCCLLFLCHALIPAFTPPSSLQHNKIFASIACRVLSEFDSAPDSSKKQCTSKLYFLLYIPTDSHTKAIIYRRYLLSIMLDYNTAEYTLEFVKLFTAFKWNIEHNIKNTKISSRCFRVLVRSITRQSVYSPNFDLMRRTLIVFLEFQRFTISNVSEAKTRIFDYGTLYVFISWVHDFVLHVDINTMPRDIARLIVEFLWRAIVSSKESFLKHICMCPQTLLRLLRLCNYSDEHNSENIGSLTMYLLIVKFHQNHANIDTYVLSILPFECMNHLNLPILHEIVVFELVLSKPANYSVFNITNALLHILQKTLDPCDTQLLDYAKIFNILIANYASPLYCNSVEANTFSTLCIALLNVVISCSNTICYHTMSVFVTLMSKLHVFVPHNKKRFLDFLEVLTSYHAKRFSVNTRNNIMCLVRVLTKDVTLLTPSTQSRKICRYFITSFENNNRLESAYNAILHTMLKNGLINGL